MKLLRIIIMLCAIMGIAYGQYLPPTQIALFDTSGSGSTVLVSFQLNGVPVTLTDSAGNNYSSFSVSVPASTAVGLGYQLTQTRPDSTHYLSVANITPGTISGNQKRFTTIIKVSSGSVTESMAGTQDGLVGGGHGIDSSYVAPNATTPNSIASGASYSIDGSNNVVPVSGSSGGSGGNVVITGPLGTAGSPNASVLTIQGITGGTPQATQSSSYLPVGATGETGTSNGSLISTATTVQIFSAAGAGTYHHVWFDFINGGSTTTEVQILSGSTVIWDGFAVANGGGFSYSKPIPLFGLTANATVSIKTLTAGASLTWNAHGYYSTSQF